MNLKMEDEFLENIWLLKDSLINPPMTYEDSLDQEKRKKIMSNLWEKFYMFFCDMSKMMEQYLEKNNKDQNNIDREDLIFLRRNIGNGISEMVKEYSDPNYFFSKKINKN